MVAVAARKPNAKRPRLRLEDGREVIVSRVGRWWSLEVVVACANRLREAVRPLGSQDAKEFCVAYRMMPAMLESNAQMW